MICCVLFRSVALSLEDTLYRLNANTFTHWLNISIVDQLSKRKSKILENLLESVKSFQESLELNYE